MKMRALVAFKSKLSKPCKKLVQIFKFRLKKSIAIRAFRFRTHRSTQMSKPKRGARARVLSWLRPSAKTGGPELDVVSELRSMTDAGRSLKLYPSPLTPAFLLKTEEDSCRSFENYLTEMLVEDGTVSNLIDVEELLYCWNNLKSPVFTALVCRFYGELCKDLFSAQSDDEGYLANDFK